MKIKATFVLSMLAGLMLLSMLLGAVLVQSVQAEAAESSLAANGDFVWAKGMGGTDCYCKGFSATVDSNGNVYITGRFTGTADFDPGPGTANLTALVIDAFILKLDPDGNFVWAKGMTGINNGIGYDVVLDTNGNVYTIGTFNYTVDFDPGPGVYNLTSEGYMDVFVSKLDNDGNFVWAKRLGGTEDDGGSSIAIDSLGNVLTTGGFNGTADFDPGSNTFKLTSAGIGDIFVSKLDSNGNFVWAKNMGGASDAGWESDFSYGIVLDKNDNVLTVGHFEGVADFDPGKGVFNLTNGGIFISKLNSSGNFVFAKSMGGPENEYGISIALDSNGNIYTTGGFSGTADFDPGAGTANLTSIGGDDIFILKLDGKGDFVWVKGLGNSWLDMSWGISLDASDNVYATGNFEGTVDFDPGDGVFKLNDGGIFILKLDKDGNFVWAKQMSVSGPNGRGDSAGIALDVNGGVYTTGSYYGTVDFDPGPNTFNLTAKEDDGNIFISKLEGNGIPTFIDVPLDHPLHDYIEALYDAGYTAGCSTSPLMYCPDTILDRAQSAVFMLRGQMGSGYTPPAAPWDTFGDNWTGFEWAEPWAEGMWQEGLTQGCQTSPLMYCPETQLPRVEASVFGLRIKYGVNYTPPAASGTVFADFPPEDPSYWAIDWAEQAYLDGLLPACGTDFATGKPMFCPSELVNRGWGAYLIVKAKNLPLP